MWVPDEAPLGIFPYFITVEYLVLTQEKLEREDGGLVCNAGTQEAEAEVGFKASLGDVETLPEKEPMGSLCV